MGSLDDDKHDNGSGGRHQEQQATRQQGRPTISGSFRVESLRPLFFLLPSGSPNPLSPSLFPNCTCTDTLYIPIPQDHHG